MLLDKSKSNLVLQCDLKPVNPKLATHHVVSLPEILASREQRQFRQQHWLADYSATLISLTIVAPGPVKDSELTRHIFNLACQAIQSLINTHHWEILAAQSFDLPTGAEALIALDIPAEQLKQTVIVLEQTHPVGRLWDIDVINKKGHILSRTEQGLAVRSCLVCADDARICARERRHTFDELIQAMQALVDGMIAHKPTQR